MKKNISYYYGHFITNYFKHSRQNKGNEITNIKKQTDSPKFKKE